MLVRLIFVQVLHAWEIRSLLKLWSASYFSDWNILYSRLPSWNIKIRLYGNTVLLFVSVSVEHGSHIPGRILRKIIGPKWDELSEALRKLQNEENHDS
jgi:hypothetical protein